MKKFLCFVLSVVFICQFAFLPQGAARVVKGEDTAVAVTKSLQQAPSNLPVDVKAEAVILMEASTGKVLMEYSADKKLYPASVTKIMTMLLVCEAISSKKISLTDMVSCSANAASKGGSQIWLEENEKMSVNDLLKATAIGSANDAATLLGEYVSGSEEAFISLMNERAKELGMKNTHFENATGLDDTTASHLTTARDIGIMSCELLKYDLITDYTTVWMDSLRGGETELVNTNKLVRFYNGTTGLKTGTTAKAGCCISASAKRDGLHLVAVVMGSASSSDRFETAKAMLNWGFSNYTAVTPEINTESVSSVPVIGGKDKTAAVTVPQILPVIVKKGQEGEMRVTVEMSDRLTAPVEKGQKIGKIKIEAADGEPVLYDLTAKAAVGKLTFYDCLQKLVDFIASGKK